MRAITQAAGANLGAVTYHFGSKWRLYVAVLDGLLAELAGRVEAAAATAGVAPDRLRRIVAAYFAFFAAHPEAARLILHQLTRGTPPPEPALRNLRRVLVAIAAVVRDGATARELRPIEPLLAAFTIVSQSVWFAAAHSLLPAIAGSVHAPLGADLSATVERHVGDVVTRGLAAGEEPI